MRCDRRAKVRPGFEQIQFAVWAIEVFLGAWGFVENTLPMTATPLPCHDHEWGRR